VRSDGPTPDSPSTTVALYYPTQVASRRIPMGPFTPNVAPQAPPEAAVKGLIILSHGTGGSELGHTSIAEALARHGYLVAALRHPGDNWQDRSLLRGRIDLYLAERPRQASRVIDALLADPAWRDRIARDSRGPRIGAVGHSAGGYTVLALAGGEPDLGRLTRHCQAERAGDPILCGLVPATVSAAPIGPVADVRVRAVAALSPLGVVFTAESLGRIRVPVAIYTAALDRFLVPRFHGDWVAATLPGATHRQVANAWHFAFMDPPLIAIPSEDGDLRADPPGFDRAAFLQQLARELPAFFDEALR
jgi:predicted dienelactone hydrolase